MISPDMSLRDCCSPARVLGTAVGQTAAAGFPAGWASVHLSQALNSERYSFFARIPLVSPSPAHRRPSSIHHMRLLAQMEILTKAYELPISNAFASGIYGAIWVLNSIYRVF